MEIKHSKWFAAGPEAHRALSLLSDGAFRLYFYICLHASRRTGRVSMSYLDLATGLGRSRRSIASHIDELRQRGVCYTHPAVNQHQCTEIEVCDEFWPYTREPSTVQSLENKTYIARIKSFIANRACVQTTFTAADEQTIANLMAGQVPVEVVERAVALGCCRRYVSLLNGTARDLIFSIGYFRDVIEEVQNTQIPSGYWRYIMPELENLEKKWKSVRCEVADAKATSAD